MKITDRETEFFEERVMEVSDNGTVWVQRVVFGRKNGKYIGWINATTVEEAKKATGITTWKFAREIKPKPKYVPFTFEDAELFMNRVLIAKDKSCKAVITYSDDEGVFFRSIARDYKYLFERFTFPDGSPCGKEVEE